MGCKCRKAKKLAETLTGKEVSTGLFARIILAIIIMAVLFLILPFAVIYIGVAYAVLGNVKIKIPNKLFGT